MTLRTKVTLALVLISVFSALMVGGVAEWILRRDFRNAVLNEAFENFQTDVIAYVHHYGSWENGVQREEFHDFVMRRRNPDAPGYDPSLKHGMEIPAIREKGIIDRKEDPPFLFMLLDPEGVILREIPPYTRGEKVDRSVLLRSYPIRVNGKIVAHAFPQGEPHLTEKDQAYFQAIREALIGGVLIASIFSLLTGLIFGRRLSHSLSHLIGSLSLFGEVIENTDADLNLESFKISAGAYPENRDELGRLAHTFNVMIERSIGAHKKLKDESIRDPLTNLYNRRHFDQQATVLYELAHRGGESLCVMLGDIDFFKKINDTYSHAVGDAVLKEIAKILGENLRKYDLLARFGGEEFVILFPRSHLSEALLVCDRIRQSIETHSWNAIQPGMSVTMSMGISDSMDLGSVGKMTVEADKYLYLAKERGRNRIEYPGKLSQPHRPASLLGRLIRGSVRNARN